MANLIREIFNAAVSDMIFFVQIFSRVYLGDIPRKQKMLENMEKGNTKDRKKTLNSKMNIVS